MNVTKEISRIFTVVVGKYYLKNPKASLMDAYITMLRKCFPELVEDDEKGKLRIKDPDNVPTYGQLSKWYEKRRDPTPEAKARKGRRHYEKNLRPLLSNSTVDAFGPGARFQIDATIAEPRP